jgi:transcriptional regulator with XRE-family HTH domain
MPDVSKSLKTLRERAGLSVRDVARYLQFENHSRYSYYEGAKFKSDLPVPLARKLAGLFAEYGVASEETLALAGLEAGEIEKEAEQVSFSPVRPLRIFMEVKLPNEASLTRMFDAMLRAAGQPDPSGELAQTLALLLPNVLAGTTGELSGEALDPDYRPLLEARLQERTKARPRTPPA